MTDTKDPEEALERIAQQELGIVPYWTNELVKYSSDHHEWEEIRAFIKGVSWCRKHELEDAERRAFHEGWWRNCEMKVGSMTNEDIKDALNDSFDDYQQSKKEIRR